MVKNHAQCVFPHAFDVGDIEIYPDDSIIIINGANEAKHSICASSDGFENGQFGIVASFGIPNMQQTWEPYSFSPLLVAIADMFVNNSDIEEDDYLKFSKKAPKSPESFLEYFVVSSAAHDYLLMRAAIKIFYDGLSDYSEAEDNTYYETRFFSDWGAGEEGTGVLDGNPESYEKPSCLGFIHKNHKYLLWAINSPDWSDVPYIKLIAENGEFPV